MEAAVPTPDYEFQFPHFDFADEAVLFMHVEHEATHAPATMDAAYFQFESQKAERPVITTEYYDRMLEAHKKAKEEEEAKKSVVLV
jgi:hypothetical protein